MTIKGQQARIVRREIYSARAVASVVVALLLILAAGWVGTEIALAALGQRPLLASPLQMAEWAAGLPDATLPAVLLAAGLMLVLLGLVVILAGTLPGSRSRHRLASDRATVIVDDGVIADALSKVAAKRARLVPDQVVTIIGRRRAQMSIRPTSGLTVNEDNVREAVQAEMARYDLDPAPRLIVRISEHGAVGI